jgi:hypothetical protein
LPTLPVLSLNEIEGQIRIQTHEIIRVTDAN